MKHPEIQRKCQKLGTYVCEELKIHLLGVYCQLLLLFVNEKLMKTIIVRSNIYRLYVIISGWVNLTEVH